MHSPHECHRPRLSEPVRTVAYGARQLLHSYQQLLTGHQKAGEEIAALRVTVSVLQQQLEGLKKLIYGSRRERFVPSPTEAETAEPTTTLVSKTTYTRAVKTQAAGSVTISTGRMKLPETTCPGKESS